jgi:hypothetical protein
METRSITYITIPKEDWDSFISAQNELKELVNILQEFHNKGSIGIPVKHITAKEFMMAVRIGRTKFSELVRTNKIKVIKKQRKIYVSANEVDRFFTDPSVK